MENEVWKPVVGYEGLYEVSDQGRVRSLNYRNTGKTELLKLNISNSGYKCVILSKYGKVSNHFVHRLVAEAFIPNEKKYPVINHKDCNRQNNVAENLEYCDWTYNNTYKDAIEKRVIKQRKAVKQLSLSGEIITIWPSIREAYRNGYQQKEIIYCCNGKHKQHKGFKWEWA